MGVDCDDTKPEFTTVCCPDGQILDGNGGCKFDPCLNKDLRHKEVADNVKNLIAQRTQTFATPGGSVAANNVQSFDIQKIQDGIGDINLDRYSLDITELPPGFSANDLFNHIRSNFGDFATGSESFLGSLHPGAVTFEPYSAIDNAIWNSNNPVGAAMDFGTLFDTATVVLTEFNSEENYWIFTTVNSVDHLGHPVSGHRKFQLETNPDGTFTFAVSGADRLTSIVDVSANWLLGGSNLPKFTVCPTCHEWNEFAFELADNTWKVLMKKLKEEIESLNGTTKPFDEDKEYGDRHEYNEEDCPE